MCASRQFVTASCRKSYTGVAVGVNIVSLAGSPGSCASICIPPPDSAISVQEQGSGYFGDLLHTAICRSDKNKRASRNPLTCSALRLKSHRLIHKLSSFQVIWEVLIKRIFMAGTWKARILNSHPWNTQVVAGTVLHICRLWRFHLLTSRFLCNVLQK